VIEKIQELADARLVREEFPDESVKEQRRKELVSQLHQVVAEMTDRMIARLNSNSFIRVPPRCVRRTECQSAACFAGQAMASVYNQGVHVDEAEVEKLKEIARKAERAGQSLILLPPHRSHIDYVTLQWIFFRLGLSLPLGTDRSTNPPRS
jgi:hypothetical protein